HQGLASNLTAEVSAVRAMRALGPDRLRDLQYFQGGEPVFTLDEAIDLQSFPEAVLDLYNAFRRGVRFGPEDVAAEFRGSRQAAAVLAEPWTADDYVDPRDIGSNNWVVSGRLTQSTFPIMANDPHRAQGAPSLRYWVHL